MRLGYGTAASCLMSEYLTDLVTELAAVVTRFESGTKTLSISIGSKMKKVGYTSDAITRRLRQTEQLRRLSLSLMKAKRPQDERQDVHALARNLEDASTKMTKE